VSGVRRNDVLLGVVVSRWDNIVGPQWVYVWTEELTSLFHPAPLPPALARLLKYVADKTVDHHEVDGARVVSPRARRSALTLVPDLDLAYVSLSIRVPGEGSAPAVPHSLALLAHLPLLNHFLLQRPLLTSWLAEFGPKVAVLLAKVT
jgi:hypothetical protein